MEAGTSRGGVNEPDPYLKMVRKSIDAEMDLENNSDAEMDVPNNSDAETTSRDVEGGEEGTSGGGGPETTSAGRGGGPETTSAGRGGGPETSSAVEESGNETTSAGGTTRERKPRRRNKLGSGRLTFTEVNPHGLPTEPDKYAKG